MTIPEAIRLTGTNHVVWRGRRLVSFSGCDYFRLSRHGAVHRAMRLGLRRQGLSLAASRLTTGHHDVYDLLEAALADFFKSESALVTPCGYNTNLMVAQAMAGEFSHVLLDARAHAALVDAAWHFKCPVKVFKHRDVRHLRAVARRCGSGARLIVLTDGLFSHDGSVAPLKEYLPALPRNARCLVDDAHGAGVLGAGGRGTPEHEGVAGGRIVQCVSLSKAFGCFGGAILAHRTLRSRIIDRSRAFMGCTALPLPLAAAALRSVELLRVGSALRKRLVSNAAFVKTALREAGLDVPRHPGPIVAVQPESAAHSRNLSRSLLRAGIFAPLWTYAGSAHACFRFVISSEHTPKQLDALVSAVTGARAS